MPILITHNCLLEIHSDSSGTALRVSTPEASLLGLWIIFLCLFCHGVLGIVMTVHEFNSLYNWCFTFTVCCDVSHFLGSWTTHTTAECCVMRELLLCWRAFWTNITHKQHAYFHFYTKSHTLLHRMIVAVVVHVCVYDLLLAILNWTLCINLLHFS
jgi:hypothetical protein